MLNFRQRAADGLEVGDTFTTSRTYTHEDVSSFARLSRDYNPVHFDVRFAKARKLLAPISHGLLTASLATEIGGQIGWLASAMNFRFKGPVYVGERISCSWVITAIDQQGRAKAVVTLSTDKGVTVVEGEISGIVPGVEERRILTQMLAEGDPSNGLLG